MRSTESQGSVSIMGLGAMGYTLALYSGPAPAYRDHRALLKPLLRLLQTWVATGHGQEDIAGIVDLITADAPREASTAFGS